jgi:methionyl-tRNA synthetase
MTDLDRAALAEVEAELERWARHLERFEIKAAMEAVFRAGQAGNRYFDESAPFRTRKTDPERSAQSLGVTVQILRMLAVMLAPVTPFAMEKLWSWLGMEGDLWRAGWDEARRPIPAGRPLGKPEILFPRLEEEQIAAEVARLNELLED